MKYPIGIQTFSEIVTDGYFYVDKTALVHRLATEGKVYFLSRPRRFGKSLLLSTLKSYFLGQKELFKGLAIEKLEREWAEYPVFHIDFNAKVFTLPYELDKTLETFVATAEDRYGKSPHAQTLGDRLEYAFAQAYQKTGRKVVVLIDEYDKPILDVLDSGEVIRTPEGTVKKLEDHHRELLKGFYGVFKDADPHLRFVFLTGVTKFSQVSVFSGFNQANDISLDARYEALCGITQDELLTVFDGPIRELAEDLGQTFDETVEQLKAQYDGYHFSVRMTDIFNPFSILNCLDSMRMDNYWFASGTPTYLVRLLAHCEENINELVGKYYEAQMFVDYKADVEKPLPMIYQSGYLTIDSYEPLLKTYTLHFPNLEVRSGMVSGLMPLILKRTTADGNSLTRNMASSLFEGDVSGAISALRSYIAKIPYDIITKEEWNDKESRESFYKLLLYMAFSMLNSIVDTEVRSILGRADVVIKTRNDIFVLELKVDDTVDHALEQIDSKGYAIPYEADGRNLTKCGVSISSEARNITHWRVVDADGNITDEQVFGL